MHIEVFLLLFTGCKINLYLMSADRFCFICEVQKNPHHECCSVYTNSKGDIGILQSMEVLCNNHVLL